MNHLISIKAAVPGSEEYYSLNDKIMLVAASIVSDLIDKSERETASRVNSSLKALAQTRTAHLTENVAFFLGKSSKKLYSQSAEFKYPCENFSEALHPFGSIMEAAVKAAYGFLADDVRPISIDSRRWFRVQRIEVSLPEQELSVSSDELCLQIKALCESVFPAATFFSKVFKIREGEIGSRDQAFTSTITRLFSGEFKRRDKFGSDGVINPMTISLELDRETNTNPSTISIKNMLEQEISDAEKIAGAIKKRVSTRLASLGWQNFQKVSVKVIY